jgi:putative SOS response-associated peptidase YedK
MCYNYQIKKQTKVIETRFKRRFVKPFDFQPIVGISGFTHPLMPLITNTNPTEITSSQWGLIPHWAKDEHIANQTLNARIETITQKLAFRDSVNNRCLVIADGFTEWKWLDSEGKRKQAYLIGLPHQSCFAFAGLYNTWVNPCTGEVRTTYTIVTTEANAFMAEIHNTKKRMPVILSPGNEEEWLRGANIAQFSGCDLELEAVAILPSGGKDESAIGIQTSLF